MHTWGLVHISLINGTLFPQSRIFARIVGRIIRIIRIDRIVYLTKIWRVTNTHEYEQIRNLRINTLYYPIQ